MVQVVTVVVHLVAGYPLDLVHLDRLIHQDQIIHLGILNDLFDRKHYANNCILAHSRNNWHSIRIDYFLIAFLCN